MEEDEKGDENEEEDGDEEEKDEENEEDGEDEEDEEDEEGEANGQENEDRLILATSTRHAPNLAAHLSFAIIEAEVSPRQILRKQSGSSVYYGAGEMAEAGALRKERFRCVTVKCTNHLILRHQRRFLLCTLQLA